MQIKNVVVVMLENRSYDNVLGWLYHSGNAPPYDKAPDGQAGLNGLTGKESNPNPFGPTPILVQNLGGATYEGLPHAATCIPIDDPGEYFKDIAQQINSLSAPASTNPYENYDPGASGLMQGFTRNYAELHGIGQKRPPAAAVPEVMNYFTPAQLPVTAFLARNYAVCDTWFASAPTQTFTNRAFALCAAPGVSGGSSGFSLVDDSQYADPLTHLPSLLSVLHNAAPATNGGPQWKVYFHDYSIAMLTVPHVKSAGRSDSNVNVSTFDHSDWGDTLPHQLKRPWPHKSGALPPTFADDVRNNTLPPFSLIEPRYGTFNKPFGITPPPHRLPANSNHPGPGYGNVSVDAPPIDVLSGELLLLEVYNMLRTQEQLWSETLLIVTYDEHGGLYDHHPPPPATPPGHGVPAASCDTDSAANGFTFNVFGCRVPAIIVSPGILPGTTVPLEPPLVGLAPQIFDHTSIIRTVWEVFGLDSQQPSLTDRDAVAPSVWPSIQNSVVNHTGPYDGPVVCGPATLVFTGHGSQAAFAGSAPKDRLTATVKNGGTWLSIPANTTGTTPLKIVATVDARGITETQTATIEVTSSEGHRHGEVTVTLAIK